MKNQDIINNITEQIELLEKRYPDSIENPEGPSKIDYRGAIDSLQHAKNCLDICGLGKSLDECLKTYHTEKCPSDCAEECRYIKVSLKQALELF